MRRIVALSLLALLGLIMSACGVTSTPTPVSIVPLRIGINAWSGNALLYIADKNNLFSAEGVQVELVRYANYNENMTDFVTKKLDGAGASYADAIAQAAAGVPEQVVWVSDNSAGGDAIVANSSITTPEDLRGKRIGVSYGTFGHVFVAVALEKYNLSQSDVTIVNISGEEVPAALQDGRIDAGHTWDPFLLQAISNGGHVLISSADTPGAIADVMFFQTDSIKNRSADIQGVIRAMISANTWWKTHQDEGNAIVAEAIDVSTADIGAILSGVQLFDLQDNYRAFDPSNEAGESLYKTGPTINDLFVGQGIISQAPDIEALLNPTFVHAVPNN